MALISLSGVTAKLPKSNGASIAERAATAATQAAVNKLSSKIPASARKHLPLARSLITGGVSGLVDAGLDKLFSKLGLSSIGLASSGLSEPTPLLGGLTAAKARELMEAHAAIDLGKKNLWRIRVRNLQGGEPIDINMLALDVSFPGFTVTGDSVAVGSGAFDNPTGTQPIEMRVTTLDDASGSVKRWMEERYRAMMHPDGTQGLPIEYVFHVEVVHAYIDLSVDGAANAYTSSFIMRPGAMDHDLSRREDAMMEVQLSFVQWDTFSALT